MEVFKSLRRYYKHLELRTPQSKGEIFGLKLYDIESLWNPKVLRYRVKALKVLETVMEEVEELKMKPLLNDTNV